MLTCRKVVRPSSTCLIRFAAFLMASCLSLMHPAYGTTQPAANAPKIQMALGFEEPFVATGPTTAEEDRGLADAIAASRTQEISNAYAPLTAFLDEHSDTAWRAGILTNLGLAYYHDGYFSKAIDAWERAWKAGRTATEPHAKAMVDRAIGELMRMHARLGHAERLAALFEEVGQRPVSGPATEAFDGAKQGLWKMRNEPGVAYLCGPMALKNVLLTLGATSEQTKFLDDYRSGRNGVSLAEVARLAEKAKLPFKPAYREKGEEIPVPAIVHWKVTHFAAIVAKEGKYYHLKDPTFGNDLWVTRDVLLTEGSGYFLLPAEELAVGFREVGAEEADHIRGMGYTGSNQSSATTPGDDKAKSCSSNKGMCGYNFTEMAVSLNLNDTPVGYQPPKGKSLFVTLTYNQREASQPANFSFFNVGPKWTLNWLSYIQDNPTIAGASVMRYVAGGGSVIYEGYNASTGTFTTERKDGSILVRTSANPVTYERRLVDGSVEVYAQSNGAASYPRLVFLTRIVDPAGNVVALNYNAQMRLTSVVDATGRSTTFSYNQSGWPLLVTGISDPFGRSATLDYDSSGRLVKITDVLGLASTFSYTASSLVNAMTTPYGTTRFVFGDNGNQRFLQATDPLGYTERLEYYQQAPSIPFSEPSNLVPSGIVAPFNSYINGRNTFYWDKYAYQQAAGNYTQARIKHWTHLSTNTSVTADTVESIKRPLESRIWFNYPGQPNGGLGTAVSGTLDKPNRMARVMDDGTTQLTQYGYNAIGNMTSMTDPLGRVTQFDYAANLVDVLAIRQKTSASGLTTIGSFTYDSRHQPLTYTDVAGQTTSFTYNVAGQRLTATDAVGHVTRYEYDSFGYLTRIVNPNDQTTSSFTYDNFGRIATSTDSEGHTTSYRYDDLDRPTSTTFPDGTLQTFTYDKLDLSSITDREGRITQYEYDANRNRTAIIDALNRRNKFAYFPNGELQSFTDPKGNATTWRRDIESRITAQVYADGSQDAYTFESRTSRLKSKTDRLGQVATQTYALDDRLLKRTYANAVNPTASVSFAYDAYFPRVASMTDGGGTTAYQYFPAGVLGALKLAGEDGPFNNDAIAYGYDALGQLTQRTVDSSIETYGYDALNRLTSHNSAMGPFTVSYLGQTDQITKRALTGGNVSTAWNYDDNMHDRRLTSIDNSGAARDYAFTISTENNIGQIAESANASTLWPVQTWNYTYDSASRLTQAQSSVGTAFNYGLDDADNITSIQGPRGVQNGTYDSLNRVSSFVGQSFHYDANGNLTDDGARTYAWDAENRLIGIGYKTTPGRSTTMRYDGLGHRIAIVESSGTSTSETRYLWCGEQICQARNSADIVTRRYTPEGEFWPSTGAQLYYAEDHLGSVRDVLAGPNGTRVTSYDYDSYGDPIASGGRTNTDFRYAGMFYHPYSGLYLTNYRAYDPKSGRFISSDPIGLAGGINTFTYVGGNPLNDRDPQGLKLPANSAHCKALREKIGRKNSALDTRYQEYADNISNLPERISPNELLSQTRRGHRTLINMEDSSLRKLEKRYSEECDDEPPPPPAPAFCPDPQGLPTWAKALGAGAIVTGVVVCALVEPCGAIVGGASALGGIGAAASQ